MLHNYFYLISKLEWPKKEKQMNIIKNKFAELNPSYRKILGFLGHFAEIMVRAQFSSSAS